MGGVSGDGVGQTAETEAEVGAGGELTQALTGKKFAAELGAGGEVDAEIHFLAVAPAQQFGIEVEMSLAVEEADEAQLTDALPVFDAPTTGLAVAVESVTGGCVVSHE